HLTGRYFAIELYPFSFREFLSAKDIENDPKKNNEYELLKTFKNYMTEGGFPEHVNWEDSEYLKRVYEDVMYKDILVKQNIRETKSFRQLSDYLFTNIAKETSYNSLMKTLGFKTVTSMKQYIHFLQNSYLLFELYKYDHSLKKQYVSNKKVYCIDNGVRNTIAFSTGSDQGRLLENLVFLELKRQGHEIYYFKNRGECDFIIKEKNKITRAIQVCIMLHDKNRERELTGLKETSEILNVKERLILTMEQEGELQDDYGKIVITPVFKWLLQRI
ncbi:MAG: ATP-binding protein, partial [Flavobacteriales bacterium]